MIGIIVVATDMVEMTAVAGTYFQLKPEISMATILRKRRSASSYLENKSNHIANLQ